MPNLPRTPPTNATNTTDNPVVPDKSQSQDPATSSDNITQRPLTLHGDARTDDQNLSTNSTSITNPDDSTTIPPNQLQAQSTGTSANVIPPNSLTDPASSFVTNQRQPATISQPGQIVVYADHTDVEMV
jgi:hypothetical protein